MHVTEISGVARAGDVIAVTAESHGRKGRLLLFLVTFDINSDVNLSFRASRRNSVKKVKVLQGSSVSWRRFFILLSKVCGFSGNLFTRKAVHR